MLSFVASMNQLNEISLDALRLGNRHPLFLIAGPCVIESESHARGLAEKVARIAAEVQIPYIFKASYDKANRSSVSSFRGPGLTEGLKILRKIKADLKVPILTDIHEPSDAASAADVAHLFQILAFLARHTDLLVAAGKTALIINVQKPPCGSPSYMKNVAEKVACTGNTKFILTE